MRDMFRDYQHAAMIPHALADSMLARLEWMRLQPETIIEFGASDDYVTQVLYQRYPDVQITQLHNDYAHLPQATDSVDLITAHLILTAENDIGACFAECFRVLKPEGLFLFTLLGPDTLQELRASLATVEQQQRLFDFIDMHDIGDALLQIGFVDPVMDCERYTIEYAKPRDVISDLRRLRSHRHTTTRDLSMTPEQWQQVWQHYETYRRNDVLPATIELIHGHAWGAQPKQRQTAEGEITVPISQIT